MHIAVTDPSSEFMATHGFTFPVTSENVDAVEKTFLN